MSTLRLISTLRSALLITKYSRLSFRTLSSIDLYRHVPVRTQQIASFSSSTVYHARRVNQDKIDLNAVEEYDNEEEEDEEDIDTDQVIFICFIKLLSAYWLLNRLILL
jgi:hypothetical protein